MLKISSYTKLFTPSYGFITIFNQVVHPVRKQASRVEKILSAPLLSNDSIVLKIMES